jgi:hypothetical protein
MKSPFLALALLRSFVLAVPYIVTNYVELSIYTDAGYTESDYTQPPTTETETYLVNYSGGNPVFTTADIHGRYSVQRSHNY